MLVNFSDREREVIRKMAVQLDISEEKVVILALRYYQYSLQELSSPSTPSPGCGVVE